MRCRHIVTVLSIAALAVGSARAQNTVTPGKPDVALLNRALLGLEARETLDTVSQLAMTASGPGTSSTFHERVHFVWQKPDQYHSDVTLINADGTPGTKYIVVCDGAQASVFDPSAKEYAVMPRAVFEQSDLGGLGLFGSLVASSIGGSTDGLLSMSELAKSGMRAAGGTVALADGTVCPVFALTVAGTGQTMRFALDPQAGTIRQIMLNGRQEGLTLALTETVTIQAPPATLLPTLFRFAPPPGFRRVRTMGIGPF